MRIFIGILLCAGMAAGAPASEFTVETAHLTWVFGADAVTHRFADRAAGVDYLTPNSTQPFARVKQEGTWQPATAAQLENGQIALTFGAGASAKLKIEDHGSYFTAEVVSVEGKGISEMAFLEVPLRVKPAQDDPFACSILALNLQTDVPTIPGPVNRLEAHAFERFGIKGARVAVVGCAAPKMRDLLKEIVRHAGPDIPQTDLGGPFAMDAEINRGSYLFDFGTLTEETVDSWIACVQSLGMNQIDFHTGTSLRFGDYTPNPKIFPKGRESVKAVIDKLHAAGISAGLHTYAFFIAKDSPYITPKPDSRLGKDAKFTLAADLSAEATETPVVETTEKMSALTGFFVQNSATIQIEDELIDYKTVRKTEPYAFVECTRGAYGTKVSAHPRGAAVHHLKECFGLFTPDADSTLLTEVAANTASAFNECGFDMIYLDALDGEGVLAGPEWAWHYGSKFVFEIANRLKKPALFEMSTFHHHLWYVRARMGAWDAGLRDHKRYIDVHVAANNSMWNTYLPMNLGWWAVKTWEDGPWVTQIEPNFPEDIEYLMGKGLANGMGFSLMGVNPLTIKKTPAFARLAPIFREYEALRHAHSVPESIQAKLREPKACFTLSRDAKGEAQFSPMDVIKHKVYGSDNGTSRWTVANRFAAQPLHVRIEALLQMSPTSAPEVVVADDWQGAPPAVRTVAGVTATFAAEEHPEGAPEGSGPWLSYRATNQRDAAPGAWSQLERTYDAPKNWSATPGLGIWVKGDGQGALLNVQLRCPEHTTYRGFGDHYITLDFTGWRYFELAEPDSDRIQDYQWPYGGEYGIYREFVDYAGVSSMSLFYNNLPVGKETTCVVSAPRALPLIKGKLLQPTLKVGEKSLRFPVELESGQYLEYNGTGSATVYGSDGGKLQEVAPEGGDTQLASGENTLELQCEAANGLRPRARVTVLPQGSPLQP